MTMAPTEATIRLDRQSSDPTSIGVARRGDEYRVIALEPIDAGSSLMEIEGLFVDRPSRYSVQLGPDIHVEPPHGFDPGMDLERYRWRYLNHSCRPNAAVIGRNLIAVRAIGSWEEVTFDYNTTEFEMASPFVCGCGHCGGRTIRGFRHLTLEEQLRLAPRLASYLRALLPRGAALEWSA
jgi:hypothetical protein